MALAGVPEDQWPEYISSEEEPELSDEIREAALSASPFVRKGPD